MLVHVYRRLAMMQQSRRFKWIASIIAALLALAYFVPVVTTAHDLASQRQALVQAFMTPQLGQTMADELANKGTTELNGRVYGSQAMRGEIRSRLEQSRSESDLRMLASFLVDGQKPWWMPLAFVETPGRAWGAMVVAMAWLALVVWMEAALAALFVLLGAGGLTWLLLAINRPQSALAVAGIGLLSFTFIMLIRLALVSLRAPNQICSIAHTVVKESVRLRVSVFFIVVLLLLLPLIPAMVSSENALRYRIQSFISNSMGATFYLAALMTIFLSCATVSHEIRDRQIWQLMTKPVTRARYLLGKWLGIVTVNLVLLLVAGVSIFTFVQFLRDLPAQNELDRRAVETEVLAARVAVYPAYKPLDRDALWEEVDRRIANDFTVMQEIQQGLRNEQTERRELARKLQQEHYQRQRIIPAGMMQEYRFEGLGEAQRRGLTLKLRYRIHYHEDSTHERHPITFIVKKNGRWTGGPIQREYVPTMSDFLTMYPTAISDHAEDAGTLTLGVVNGFIDPETGDVVPGPNTPYSLNFDPEDLEVLFIAGTFEGNYFRAMLVMWVKLAFLAMLGIACATTLSFPVACMTSLTIFLAATIGPFLADSLQEFHIPSAWRIDRVVIKAIATVMVYLFEPFGQFDPTGQLVEGRLIAWRGVIRAFGQLGILWNGLALVLGYLAFRDRELATYSGQG